MLSRLVQQFLLPIPQLPTLASRTRLLRPLHHLVHRPLQSLLVKVRARFPPHLPVHNQVVHNQVVHNQVVHNQVVRNQVVHNQVVHNQVVHTLPVRTGGHIMVGRNTVVRLLVWGGRCLLISMRRLQAKCLVLMQDTDPLAVVVHTRE